MDFKLGPNDSASPFEAKKEEERKPEVKIKEFAYKSSSLPFGQDVPLSSISGPTYLTAQTLVQQVAFTLSDKTFTYSPETFDLDLSLKSWQKEGGKNGFGYQTGISPMEIRAGAGSIALGYMFSKDFDLEKRHIPQSIIASAAALHHLRPSLDQLSLLYSVANPVVAHVAAVDYVGSSTSGLVTDYVSSMALADEVGLGLVSSCSSFEAQHMSLFGTLLAKIMPSIHIFDGVNVGRETTRVVDVLSQKGLFDTYSTIEKDRSGSNLKSSDIDGKTKLLFKAFNEELGTDYKPFEYYGHAEPESVLIVFGSVEGSLAAQLAHALGNTGAKVGAINVRMYRPFLEEDFLEVLPKTVQNIAVLGQVTTVSAVQDDSDHSKLYEDVLAAVSFSTKFAGVKSTKDVKYSREEVWTPSKMLYVLQHVQEGIASANGHILSSQDRPNLDLLGSAVKRYTLWDVDDAASIATAPIVGSLLSNGPHENVTLRTAHDNLARGGTIRSDIRCSEKSIEAPYPITSAEVTFVGEEKLLTDFDIIGNAQDEGAIIVKLRDSKDKDSAKELEKLEKRLPESFRKAITEKKIQLFILDPAASTKAAEDARAEALLTQLAFLRIAGHSPTLDKIAAFNGDVELLEALQGELDDALRQVEIPEAWSSLEAGKETTQSKAAADLTHNSFAAHDKTEKEDPTLLKSWQSVAKALAFSEALTSAPTLRPDLGIKTMTIQVKERRRLTPVSYDRNIFHIEFDIGTSGLTYAIGESLGIHHENDATQVEEFIKWYGLNHEDIVEVPSRDDFNVLESRTVWQALTQNVDIFGRPPKRFYEALSEYASDENEQKQLLALGGSTGEGTQEFKRRSEVDTVTYADILLEFPSAHPAFHDIVRIVSPMKRREYSIASSQKVQPDTVSLLIVTVGWVDPKGRDRFGQATRYLNALRVGQNVTVSVKPSVMKLPEKSTAPLIMTGLGTGLAPFRAFVQERAWQKQQGMDIGSILLYMGSRTKREEYLYGEEWEAYRDSGIITYLGCAFSRDQAQKIYVQDVMRNSLNDIRQAYLKEEGSFYLCGPTWPVPDVTNVLEEAIEVEGKAAGKKVEGVKEIEKLKDELRYVLEVY
jgi:sulfite reductase (NADPH) flavoprotein alpha-component